MTSRKFAVTASDRFIGVLKAFVACGWEPIKLFTAPVSSHMASNQAVIELARSLGMAIQLSRMQAHDLADLRDAGCELLVLGSYQWRVGDWGPYVARAINFHPAPLPAYRGPYPMVQGLLDGCTTWATTCHKVAAEFDAGDILAQRHFAVDPHETHESLDLKAQIETRQLAQTVAHDLDALWDQARPQDGGHYVPLWTDSEREIDFGRRVEQIELQLRAFGDFECIATVNGMRYFVRRAVCWEVPHDSAPGTLVHVDGQKYVVACQDGCVALLDWSLVPPGVRIASAARS